MKKRILTFCLAFFMSLTGVLTLSACTTKKEDNHVCNEKISYIVEENKAYEVKSCECGKTSKTELNEDEYVIANTDNVQSVLDQNINNKKVIFDEGVYNDVLEIRASKATATVRSIINGGSEWGDEDISIDELSDSVNGYNYFRTLENVTFIGTENATFKKAFVMETSSIAYYQTNHTYDAVREMDYTTDQTLRSYNHLTLNNVTIKNMNFSTTEARIIAEITLNSGSINGLTIDGCNFVGDNSIKANAVRVGVNKGNLTDVSVKNLTFTNNTVSNYYKAFDFLGFENATVTNNVVSNCKHNAFGFYSYHESDVDDDHVVYITGNILIENNIISNGEDRAIKIHEMKNGTITVKNNTITNYSDGEDVLQFKLIYNSSLLANNNTYNGTKLAEHDTNDFETIAIKIAE